MYIDGKRRGDACEPLERLTLCEVSCQGWIVIRDAVGHVYMRVIAQPVIPFIVAGALGYHTVSLEDDSGQVCDTLTFYVDAQTTIVDEQGRFSELLRILLYTMLNPTPHHSNAATILYRNRIYQTFSRWLRFHVYTLKGLKYFAHHLKDGIDLYRDSQREDGLIWDNFFPRSQNLGFWDLLLHEGNFIRPFDDGSAEFRRMPVECDVEYLFVEGLYATWKATGDDAWMSRSLDAALHALTYSRTNVYRWSEHYQLLKRGLSIDTWDFLLDAKRSMAIGGNLYIDTEMGQFGIMFGDNTGYIAACRHLSEMLTYVGRTDEAESYTLLASEIQQRLDAVAWNGSYYTHFVPEPGGDFSFLKGEQLSLSNAFSLNRGISHEQSVSIIRSYQQLRENLPLGSPGEWYTIYPPFEGAPPPWHYVNGGVSPLVAGELALGAFKHGHEPYAADILLRLLELGKKYQGHLHGAFTGYLPPRPEGVFVPVDIAAIANTDVSGEGRMGVPGWTNDGENDLHELPNGLQELSGIPFLIPDPETNAGRGCIGVSVRDGYARRATVYVPADAMKATSIYFLHTVSQPSPSNVGGTITLHYSDGSTFSEYVVRDLNVLGWWCPELTDTTMARKVMDVAWRGQNKRSPHVGVTAYGMDNPYPELEIERITLTAAEDGAFWAIFAITISDQKAYFEPNKISSGISDDSSAAAVTSALIEGLAGVVDDGVCYNKVLLAPRWSAAQVERVRTVVRYPASQGYVAYTYVHDHERHVLELEVTGSGESCQCHVLLPVDVAELLSVSLADQPLAFTLSTVERSQYVDFSLNLPGPLLVTLAYTPVYALSFTVDEVKIDQ